MRGNEHTAVASTTASPLRDHRCPSARRLVSQRLPPSTNMANRRIRLLPFLVLLGVPACASDSRAAREPARAVERAEVGVPAASAVAPPAVLVAQQGDSARRVTPKPRPLTDDEQRVADGLVFAPNMIERFVVASRNKRLFLDLGRVDLETKQDAKQLALVRRVASLVGPLSHASFVRVRGSWGMEVDSITGYDVWNGRIVAVLAPSARADSLLRKSAPLLGVATRRDDSCHADTTAPDTAAAAAVGCARDSVPPALPARVAFVRDSLVRWVTDSLRPPFGLPVKHRGAR